MRTRWLVLLLLLSSVALAQNPKPVQGPTPSIPQAESAQPQTNAATPATAAKPPEPAAVPDSAPVITIDGVCNPDKAEKTSPSPCRTEITKAEFDLILSALTPPGAPSASPAMKRQSAEKLAELITVASAAEKSGVQNAPQTQQLLRIARLQTLATGYARQLQQTSKPTDAEIEAYYKANQDKYQKVVVNQVFVPPLKAPAKPAEKKAEGAAAAKPEPEPANKETAEKARAEKLRERALAGEPFDKLEKEAIQGTAYQTAPPGELTLQRESTPPQRQFLFNLKEGEVSNVISEPSGLTFFKLVSKTAVPLDQVKSMISQQLTQEKFRSTIEAIRSSSKPVLNEAYFGPATPAAMPGAPMPMRPGVGPGPRPRPTAQPNPAPTAPPK